MQEPVGASMCRQVSLTSSPSPASTALCLSGTRTPCSEVGRPCRVPSHARSNRFQPTAVGCSTSPRSSTLICCHHTGKEGQTRKQGKQQPKKGGSYTEDYKPKQAGIFSNARNAPREKGFGGGGPWQKIDPKTPGVKHWNCIASFTLLQLLMCWTVPAMQLASALCSGISTVVSRATVKLQGSQGVGSCKSCQSCGKEAFEDLCGTAQVSAALPTPSTPSSTQLA